MRVKRQQYIPSIFWLQEELSLENTFGLFAPEPVEDPNEVISEELFHLLKPGNERVCIVLRSDGLTYNSIGEIMGLTESQVKNIVYTIRKRLVEKKTLQEMQKML